MFKGNSLTDFTNLFSPNTFKKNDDIILNYFLTNFLKCINTTLLKPNIYPNLKDKINKIRINKINEIKDYFVEEIKGRKLMSKSLRKYIASFDYIDKSLIVLSATSNSISIASFATVLVLVLHFQFLQEL